jgi:hypothetical protein
MKPLDLSFGRLCGKMTGHGNGWNGLACIGAGCFSRNEATTSSTGLGGTSFSSSYDGGESSSPAAASRAHSSSSPWKSSLSDPSWSSSSTECFSGGYGEVDRACGFGDLGDRFGGEAYAGSDTFHESIHVGRDSTNRSTQGKNE